MRLTIESTDIITTIDGVPVRLWRGRTRSGHELDVFIHRLASADPAAQAELSTDLMETLRPVELAEIEAQGRREAARRN